MKKRHVLSAIATAFVVGITDVAILMSGYAPHEDNDAMEAQAAAQEVEEVANDSTG